MAQTVTVRTLFAGLGRTHRRVLASGGGVTAGERQTRWADSAGPLFGDGGLVVDGRLLRDGRVRLIRCGSDGARRGAADDHYLKPGEDRCARPLLLVGLVGDELERLPRGDAGHVVLAVVGDAVEPVHVASSQVVA